MVFLQNLVRVLAAAATVCMCVPAWAQGDGGVYKCKDTNGVVMFTNNPSNPKGCEKIQVQAVSTIPAPKMPASKNGGGGSGAASSPASFPKVDPGAQKNRDEGRRDLLEDELVKTESKCAALKKDLNNGQPERQGNERNYAKYEERVAKMKDDVARCESDVVALKKEIALIK